jgi:amino acid permease
MISTVVGGQTLVTLSNDALSVQSGIVIIALISMFVSIAGYKIIHAYLRYAWIPALIAIIICVGVGGKHPKEHAPTEAPQSIDRHKLCFHNCWTYDSFREHLWRLRSLHAAYHT